MSQKNPYQVMNHFPQYYNQIFLQDCRHMKEIPDESVHLMITSPPYNVTKTYDQNLTLQDYLDLLEKSFSEVYRVLNNEGFIAVNIANVGRKPYIPLDCMVIKILQKLNFIIFQEIIWNKEASAGGSCAWGSWMSASNPSLRDVHEYIIIASKSNQSIKDFHLLFEPFTNEKPITIENKTINIKKEGYLTNIWDFQTESAKRVNHPAPFPVELPLRIIKMFSKPNDLVLDPFIGSGTTAIAALASKRNYVGYEINPEFVDIAKNRIFHYQNAKNIQTTL
jgi:DNA modification methylase